MLVDREEFPISANNTLFLLTLSGYFLGGFVSCTKYVKLINCGYVNFSRLFVYFMLVTSRRISTKLSLASLLQEMYREV